MYTVCLPGIFSLYAYRRTFSIHFFFYSLRLSLRSLTKEKGKEEEGLTYCVLLDLVQTHLCCFGKRRDKNSGTERYILVILKRIPRFFSLIHPQKKGEKRQGVDYSNLDVVALVRTRIRSRKKSNSRNGISYLTRERVMRLFSLNIERRNAQSKEILLSSLFLTYSLLA